MKQTVKFDQEVFNLEIVIQRERKLDDDEK